jgi:hypothetical protein
MSGSEAEPGSVDQAFAFSFRWRWEQTWLKTPAGWKLLSMRRAEGYERRARR